MADKRYYWIKLPTDYFSRPTTIMMMSGENGRETFGLYMKMLTTSADKGGKLRFSDNKAYSPSTLSVIFGCTVDVAEKAIETLLDLELLKILEDGTYYLTELENMVGSESEKAEAMRNLRKKEVTKDNNASTSSNNASTSSNNVSTSSNNVSTSSNNVTKASNKSEQCYLEKEKEKEKEKRDIKDSCPEPSASEPQQAEKESSAVITLPLNTKEEYPLFQENIDEWKELYPSVDVSQELRNMRGWLMANPSRRKTKSGVMRFINSWLSKEQNQGGSLPKTRDAPQRKNAPPEREYTEDELCEFEKKLLRGQYG